MNKISYIVLAKAVFISGTLFAGQQATQPPLRLVQQFKLPVSIKGHFDHFAVDAKQHRMFAAAVDHKALLVLDTRTGKLLHSISMEVPRAIVYREDLDRIYVSEGGEGALRIYDGKTYKLLKSVKLQVDADPIVYDPDGANTARLVTELGRYFVLSPQQKNEPAKILVFDIQ